MCDRAKVRGLFRFGLLLTNLLQRELGKNYPEGPAWVGFIGSSLEG